MNYQGYIVPLASDIDPGFNIQVSPKLVSHFGERNGFDRLVVPERVPGAVLVLDRGVQRAVVSELKGSDLVFYVAPDLLIHTLANNDGELYLPEFFDRMRNKGYKVGNPGRRKCGSIYKALLDTDRRTVTGRFPGNLPKRSRVKLDSLRRHHEWHIGRSSKHLLNI